MEQTPVIIMDCCAQTLVEGGTAGPAAVAATQMNKAVARDLLNRSLPVPDEVLRVHVDRLIHVGQRAHRP